MAEFPRRRIRTKLILCALIALTLLFIFGNSLQSRAVSGGMSSSLAAFLSGALGFEVPEFFLRKAAHFSEYALLGLELALLLNPAKACGRDLLDLPLLGLLTAVFDETLQIFSGRGSMVADVWIDLAGFVTGFYLTVLTAHALHKYNKYKTKGRSK